MELLLIAKILIVVVVEIVMMRMMIGGAATVGGAMVVIFVVSTDFVLILIVVAAVVVIVLVVWWRCTGTGCRQAGRRRRCWWRYKYVVLIFRKIQIIIDIVVLATVVLLEHAVGVLDTWRLLRRMLVGCGAVEILILFQIVDEWTPFGVGGSTAATTPTATAVVGVVFQYPNRAGMVVQQLFLVIKCFRCRPRLLTVGVVVVVSAGGMMVVGVGTQPGMFSVFARGSGWGDSLRHWIVMGIYRLQGMWLLLVVVAVQM